MRRYIHLILILIAVAVGYDAHAQYNKEYFFWTGRNLLIDNNYREAIETLNILLKVDEDAHEAYFLRGVAKYNLNDLLGAEQDFTTAVTKNPVYTLAFTYRAITRSRMGNYDDALADFQEAIELRPDMPNPYYSRGVTRLLNRQFEEAIEDFDMFIRHNRRVADAYINRGLCYLHLKDTVTAYENYNTAIRTNRDNPDGYNYRGSLYMTQKHYSEALEDFNRAITCDSTYIPSYFNRALVNANTNKLMPSLADFDKVIQLDSTSSIAYFNRAILRSQIGDYNRAIEDYNRVATYSPDNVLVYYNRASISSQLGDLESAEQDYSKAIALYPDFAAAYLNRSSVRYMRGNMRGSKQDYNMANRKITEYKSRLNDTTYSIYADTTYRFDKLLSLDTKMSGGDFERISTHASGNSLALLPMFRFTLYKGDTVVRIDPKRYYLERVEAFKTDVNLPNFMLSNRDSDVVADSLMMLDRRLGERLKEEPTNWLLLFERGITQSLIKQYTNSVSTYTSSIERNPVNPFIYFNRATTRAEMIDFISSIENSYQRISIESSPESRLQSVAHTYSYDEAIADLNSVIKLYPEFAHAYYNRANLMALSGKLPEAYDDYTKAIELNSSFAEAYYNRGLVQIFLKDTRKGCLDMSKAGEMGIEEAYTILHKYTPVKN